MKKKRIISKEKNYLAHTVIDQSLELIRTEGCLFELKKI